MSDSVSQNTQTTWTFNRSTLLRDILVLIIIPVLVFGGIAVLLIVPQHCSAGLACVVAGSIMLPLFIYYSGLTQIVFDDNSQTIYVEERRCCNKRLCPVLSSVTALGTYAKFQECYVTTHSTDNSEYYTLDFKFGKRVNGGRSKRFKGTNKKQMEQMVAEINQWWDSKAAPKYTNQYSENDRLV